MSLSKYSKSIFSYFNAKGSTDKENTSRVPTFGENSLTGLSSREVANIVEEIREASGIENQNKKRVTYKEQDKLRVAKYASQYGPTRTVTFFSKEFPSLSESTVRPWVQKYRSQIREMSTRDNRPETVKIGEKRGRPLPLPDELDRKLRSFIISLRAACLWCINGSNKIRSEQMG